MYPEQMAPLPPINGVLKLEVIGNIGTQIFANVFHCFYTPSSSALTSAQVAQAAQNVQNAWQNYMLAMATSDRKHIEIVATDLNAAGLKWVSSFTSSGTRAGEELPANVAAVLDLNSSAPRYRGGHPRISFPFGAWTDLQDAQHWTTAFQTALATAWTNASPQMFNVTLTGGATSGSQCFVSYHSGKALRPTPLAFSINSYAPRPMLGSMRRRIGRPPRF